MLTKDKILEIPVSQIVMSNWDVRLYPESQEELQTLAQSIQTDGLINPITVTPTQDGKYQVIAGRRRFRACKSIGIDKVPCYIKFDTKFTETDLRRVTLIENLHRKDLKPIEKANGIMAVFESATYSFDDAIGGVKSIDNWFSHHTDNKTDWDAYMHKGFMHRPEEDGGRKEDSLRHDRQFVDICKSIGITPKSQYQFLQFCQFSSRVQQELTDIGLGRQYITLLTNKVIQGYDNLIIALANHIKNLELSSARFYVQQLCHDIKTGYLKIKPEDTEFPIADLNKKERIQQGDKAAKSTLDYYLDIGKYCTKLMYSLTGRSLTHGEGSYTKDMITGPDAHNHRLQIVKSLDSSERELSFLYRQSLGMTKLALEDMLKIIEQEMQTIEKKREMLKE